MFKYVYKLVLWGCNESKTVLMWFLWTLLNVSVERKNICNKFFHNIIKQYFWFYVWDDKFSFVWNDIEVNYKKRLLRFFFFLTKTNLWHFHKAFGLNLRNLAAEDKGREKEQESSKGGLPVLNANIFIKIVQTGRYIAFLMVF